MHMTFGMIKPDAVFRNLTGDIIKAIELNGFKIVGMKKTQLTDQQAREFYGVHSARSFFGEMIQNITAGPVVLLALEAPNAIGLWRTFMGATNPANAEMGTLRKMFAKDISFNSVHGSDSEENAKIELNFFFPELKNHASISGCCGSCKA
jgi:nucleoside-diphosphate kinase